MNAQWLYDADGSVGGLRGKTVAVLGYGSQGRAHALNLRDSGVRVVVANRVESENGRLAVADGFSPVGVGEAVGGCDLFVMGLPDEVQPEVFEEEIRPRLRKGMTFGAVHGFNIHFKTIVPPEDIDVVLVGPKAQGATLRSEYERGGGVVGLMAVHQDATGRAEETAVAWAIGIGCGRAGILKSTFRDETEADLFGEQSVLCGGLAMLVKTGFDVLVEAGYPPEVAYFEVCHELKPIVNLIERGGLSFMREKISNTAEFGDYLTGPKVIGPEVKAAMEKALAEIQKGEFAKVLREDYSKGFKWFKKEREKEKGLLIEKVGKEIRKKMPWIKPVGD